MDAQHDRGLEHVMDYDLEPHMEYGRQSAKAQLEAGDLTRRLQAAAQNDADCRGILALDDPHELDNILGKVNTMGDEYDHASYLRSIKNLDLRAKQVQVENLMAAAEMGADCGEATRRLKQDYGQGYMPPQVPSKPDMVVMPAHYAQFKIEPIHFCMVNELDGFQCAIIKYVCRHKLKNGIEDIDKMLRYGQMYRLFLLGDDDWWKRPKQ